MKSGAQRSSTTASLAVALVATHTVDHIPDGTARGFIDVPGGPARYVGEALRELRQPFTLFTGEEAQVQVVNTPEGQQYIIPPLPPIPLPDTLTADAIILSPIMREIDVANLPHLNGIVIADLQGFVRTPFRPTDETDDRFALTALFRAASIVKATERELARLDEESKQALVNVILLVTAGDRGAAVRVRGKETWVSARPVKSTHCIGAGDIFLAAFTVATLEGQNPVHATECAARFTEDALARRARIESGE